MSDTLSKKKLDDKIVKILAVFGLFVSIAYLVFYLVGRDSGPGSYTIFFILLYMLLPFIILLFFLVHSYEKALAFLVIQNFIELFLNSSIIHWGWIFSFLFFLVLIIPQIKVLKHIKQPLDMKKTTRKILTIAFLAFVIIYFGCVLFDLWKTLQPDSISNGSFPVYILYIARHFIRLISYLCITIILFRYFTDNEYQVEKSDSI